MLPTLSHVRLQRTIPVGSAPDQPPFERRLRRRNLLVGEASEGGRSPPPSSKWPVLPDAQAPRLQAHDALLEPRRRPRQVDDVVIPAEGVEGGLTAVESR